MSVHNSMAWRVEQLTARRLEWLLDQAPQNVCKATLAELRRGVGRAPGDIPALWGMFLQDMPEDMQGKGTDASRQEIAVYTALTLFGVHQQGWDPARERMHRAGNAFGSAVARLAPAGDADARERVERRFSRAATSVDMTEFVHHLRGLVQLLRADGIPLDWAQLAGQLYLYQDKDRVSGVRLRWGEDFYSALNRKENKEEEVEP
ncbi:MAG: type I-E CRISPR-associated protein Cse2/CasB [Clostridia bacterium]|nr:type I-E CRISPR-associated protein Cse2/CasB [Clostridia bacterium]